ncbi:MAG: STAS/SEC14 domain-containing protein [Anaerolineae bacterium]|nr:STAS/SEC14 domain-containing protein [Anaerolineae bacterium]
MPEGLEITQTDGITIYTFTNSSEAAIDAWGMALIEHIEALPTNQSFRVLMDVSSNQVNFSRYARQKSIEMFTRFRKRKGRYAFLFSSRTAPYYSRIFFASLGRLEFELNYFSNREKALAWLHDS